MTITTKSVLNESKQIERAAMLIEMGARMQVLESETTLSYERLIRLYKEIAGKSPSKGQLPFSTDWFLTWQENIHSSLFLNIYEYLSKGMDLDSVDLLTKAYRLYSEQVAAAEIEPLLSFTRAWRLVKFVDANMLTRTECSQCHGQFVTELYENARHYTCGLCNPPARAGKSKNAGALMIH
jgi:flagellar transcriptional activator FlhC